MIPTNLKDVQNELVTGFILPDGTFPLRLPCHHVVEAHPSEGLMPWAEKLESCPHCSGLGYIFNPDPDVLWDAVRAKGWGVTLETGVSGYTTQVKVWLADRAHQWDEIALVDYDEGLRGQAALQTALFRAMEATKND